MLCNAMHGLRHTIKEKFFRIFLAPMSVWRSNKFLHLGNRKSRKKLWENRTKRPAHPEIKEVRQIRITNVIVVWRIR